MIYACGHNLDGSTPEPSDRPLEQQMPRHTGLCSRCQADTYPAHHPLGGGGFQASEIREWPKADFVHGVGFESDICLDGINEVTMGLAPTTWPTYGGITRGDFGDLTTPTIAANYPPSDAGNITLDTLLKQMDALPKFPKMPAYYRCHPTTYANMTRTLCNKPDRPDWLPDWINFAGVQIVPDTEVTPGEFWPPEDEGKGNE